MGLLKCFDVLIREILGTVQESQGHWKRFSIFVLTLVVCSSDESYEKNLCTSEHRSVRLLTPLLAYKVSTP